MHLEGAHLKRFSVLVATAALFIGTLVTSALPATPGQSETLTYDQYLQGHAKVPATAAADRFIKGQEKLNGRLAPGQGYGKAGCQQELTYEVGDQRQFWVSKNVANTPTGNEQIMATLAAKSEHGYVWVQNEYYIAVPSGTPEGGFVTQSEAEDAAADWDQIYDINRSYFGLEPHQDVVPKNLPPGLPSDWRDADCDPRVHILNFPIDTPGPSLGYIAGYYSSEHEYPNGEGEHESPFSNEAEMFFMNSATLNVGDDTYAGVLAHEFFHMIQFGNDYNEATWVNEGMADIAAVVNGFADVVDGHISAYEDAPDQHLFDWKSDVADYGQAFLFFDYFFNHYGTPEDENTPELEAYGLAKLLTSTRADGKAGIKKVIETRADSMLNQIDPYFHNGSFNKVFKDYLIANFLDAPDAGPGQFGYANRDVSVASAGTADSSADGASVFPYGGEYYDLTGDGGLGAEAQDPVAIIPATEGQPKPKGGKFAWGNRGDEMITWMERRADLSDTTTPTLVFKHWFQIEEDWDYGYVRVSQDAGATYDYLTTTDCGGRATDPNGNNRAVTESGGITGDSAGWQTCSLDLTTYAGGPVLIRFEYDTDQATTEPGWAIDNVKLKDGDETIWRTSKFENKKSLKRWTLDGDGLLKWLPIAPLAKNKPLIQIVNVTGEEISRSVFTRKRFIKGGGLGLKLTRAGVINGDRTILIFSGLTPIATDPFAYNYTIQR